MLIFIYGPDTFRSQEKLKSLREHFTQKYDPSGMNINEFRGSFEYGEVAQAVSSAPFMSEKRLVVIDGLLESLQKNKNVTEWETVFKNHPDSAIVIFHEELELDKIKKNALYKALQKGKEAYDYPFPLLQPAEVSRWIAGRVKELGGTISSPAAAQIVQLAGNDLWQINGEVEKLAAYADGQMISPEMVAKLVRGSFDDRIFDFVDAVSQRRGPDVIRLIDEERQSGATDQHIMSMLARQVRILLQVKSLLSQQPTSNKQEVAGALGLHPFVAQKALAQARNFEAAELTSAHARLLDYDLAVKTGKMAPDLALDKFVGEIV